jgi:hypothetical protein
LQQQDMAKGDATLSLFLIAGAGMADHRSLCRHKDLTTAACGGPSSFVANVVKTGGGSHAAFAN